MNDPTLLSSQPPSLVGSALPPPLERIDRADNPHTLLDVMLNGFYMIVLLRNRYSPADADVFRSRIRDFLGDVDKGGRRLGLGAEDLHLAKYAFSALVDETVMTSQSNLRASWERRPLQLELFGDQLAGDQFFDRLETLRREGVSRVQVLEVFHMALLLGFQGRFRIEGQEKLAYLTARLGDEIATLKGSRAAFAPRGLPPDTVRHKLRHEVPLWIIASAFALAGLLAYLGMRWWLERQTQNDLSAYSGVIKMPEQPAYITITLP